MLRTPARTAASAPSAPCACRSEEHTSELQSLAYLVCRLLLEKKNAQPELRAERIADAHERRQSRNQLQVLRALDRRAAGAELTRADRRDRDDAKARERVVERYVDAGFARRIERNARVPQQERVEEFARRAVSAAAARRHRLAPEVTPPDDLHFFFSDAAATEIYTLSLHDALPI